MGCPEEGAESVRDVHGERAPGVLCRGQCSMRVRLGAPASGRVQLWSWLLPRPRVSKGPAERRVSAQDAVKGDQLSCPHAGRTGIAQPRHGQLRSILHPLEVENSSLISTFVAK